MATCKICGNTEQNKKYKIKEKAFGMGDEFNYILCANCGCLQIEKAPDDMSKYYPRGYYSFRGPSEKEAIIKKMLRKCRDRYAIFGSGILGRLLYCFFPNVSLRSLSRLPINKSWKILDVGCGSGALISSLYGLGFKNLLGVDPYIRPDIVSSGGYPILKKSLKDLKGSFDLIMFHHSFEHMEPVEALEAAAEHMLSDSFCLVRIPLSDSWAWKYYGVNWVQIDAPRHLFLHTQKSMKLLAERAGLKIVDIVYDSTDLQFKGSEKYKRGMQLYCSNGDGLFSKNRIFSWREIMLFKKKARILNIEQRGDQASFYMKKV